MAQAEKLPADFYYHRDQSVKTASAATLAVFMRRQVQHCLTLFATFRIFQELYAHPFSLVQALTRLQDKSLRRSPLAAMRIRAWVLRRFIFPPPPAAAGLPLAIAAPRQAAFISAQLNALQTASRERHSAVVS